jgi:hypothetical protein
MTTMIPYDPQVIYETGIQSMVYAQCPVTLDQYQLVPEFEKEAI